MELDVGDVCVDHHDVCGLLDAQLLRILPHIVAALSVERLQVGVGLVCCTRLVRNARQKRILMHREALITRLKCIWRCYCVHIGLRHKVPV